MWYLSVTLLVIMVTFLTIRCLLFFFAWIAGYEFWVLPRLFDETLAFAESFTPVRRTFFFFFLNFFYLTVNPSLSTDDESPG